MRYYPFTDWTKIKAGDRASTLNKKTVSTEGRLSTRRRGMYSEYDDLDDYYSLEEKVPTQEEDVKAAIASTFCCSNINGTNELIRMPIMKFYEKERPSWQSVARSILNPGFLNQNRTVLKYKLTQKPLDSMSPMKARHLRSSSKHILLRKVQSQQLLKLEPAQIANRGLQTPHRTMSSMILEPVPRSFAENWALFNSAFPPAKLLRNKKIKNKKARPLSLGQQRSEEWDTIFLRNADIIIPCKKISKFANPTQAPGERKRRKSCFCDNCGGSTELAKKIRDALPENPIKHYLKNPLTRMQNQFARTVLSVQGSLNLIMQFKRKEKRLCLQENKKFPKGLRRIKLKKENSKIKVSYKSKLRKVNVSPKKAEFSAEKERDSSTKKSFQRSSTGYNPNEMNHMLFSKHSLNLRKMSSNNSRLDGADDQSNNSLSNSKVFQDTPVKKQASKIILPEAQNEAEDLKSRIENRMVRRSSQKVLNISNLITKFVNNGEAGEHIERKIDEMMLPRTATLPAKFDVESPKLRPVKSEFYSAHKKAKQKPSRRFSLTFVEDKSKSELNSSDVHFIRPQDVDPHKFQAIKEAFVKGERENAGEAEHKMRIIKMKSLELDAFKDELKSEKDENSPGIIIPKINEMKNRVEVPRKSLKNPPLELILKVKSDENHEDNLEKEKPLVVARKEQNMKKALARSIIEHKRLGFNKSVELFLNHKNSSKGANQNAESGKKPTPFTVSTTKSSGLSDDVFFPSIHGDADEQNAFKPNYFSQSRKNLSRVYKSRFDEQVIKKEKSLMIVTPNKANGRLPSISQPSTTPNAKGLNKGVISLYLPHASKDLGPSLKLAKNVHSQPNLFSQEKGAAKM